MKFSEFYKILEKNGWKRSEDKKHAIYTLPDFDYFIPVGRHPSKEI
ncbi:type II toxin-antitoxin system HicA family toxin [Porphyromonas somerae]|nr:type II toxin-antitoxin system HicA family toxin [Porphyromonas somerae]MDY3884410.1 type II toxin-antitoxin system HicA family toxin [Porphyromonas somerae]